YGGPGGSRKYLLASLDASLRRLGLDYVDIFYSHRPDATTPLEETIGALDTAVRSGRALYAGISSYSAADTARAAQIARDLGTPLLIHQPSYSMVNRWIEDDGLLETTDDEGLGVICFSPLAQGLLTDKYLGGVPADSRAGKSTPSFRDGFLSEDNLARIRSLNDIAGARGQSRAQMALAWALRDERVSLRLRMRARLSSLRKPSLNDGVLLPARESAGTPPRYLSVSRPCASGEKQMTPRPSSSVVSSSPLSSIHRLTIE